MGKKGMQSREAKITLGTTKVPVSNIFFFFATEARNEVTEFPFSALIAALHAL